MIDVYNAFQQAMETEDIDLRDHMAFAKLIELGFPKDQDMIIAAEHDVAIVNIDPDWLGSVATQEDINYLVRCGITYDETYGYCIWE